MGFYVPLKNISLHIEMSPALGEVVEILIFFSEIRAVWRENTVACYQLIANWDSGPVLMSWLRRNLDPSHSI